MDAQKRKRTDPKYDPTTVHVPPFDYVKLTQTMKQFWDIKSTMFDKVIFFKLGKFYEMFYNDAIICQKVFDLGWTNEPRKLHVGFPEKSLEKNIEILIGLGYKVAVVE